MLNIKLQNLPPFAKLFVGMTTVLMLCVVLWSMYIFTIDKGFESAGGDDGMPAFYLPDDANQQEVDLFLAREKIHQLRLNAGLAHTHINGQTLLYFVLGFLFLFTSTKDKIKKYVYWLFGITVFVHTVGLTGAGFFSIFDDLLALSGVALLVIIPYMCFLIIIDLFKLSEPQHEQ